MQYRPVYHHWFYRKEVETKVLWLPFSMQDSLRLEEVHNSSEITPETTVATDGGRYDVDILRRERSPVYWTGKPTEVRRSSWFYKGSTESRYIPYEESISARLEEEYKEACRTDNWNRRIELNNGEYIIFHSSIVQVHYVPATSSEIAASWGNSSVSPNVIQTSSASSLLPVRSNATLPNFVNPLRKVYTLLTQVRMFLFYFVKQCAWFCLNPDAFRVQRQVHICRVLQADPRSSSAASTNLISMRANQKRSIIFFSSFTELVAFVT